MDKSRLEISWMTAARPVLIVAGLLALWHLRDIVVLILAAIVIAAAIERPIISFARRGLPRFLAVFIIYLAGILSLITILYFAVPMLIVQARDLAAALLLILQEFEVPVIIPDIKEFLHIISERLTAVLPAIGRGVGEMITFLSGAFGMVFGAILVLVLSFYIALHENWVKQALRSLAPRQYEDYVVELWGRAERKIGKWFYAQVTLSLITSTLVFIGLSILGVEAALLLAVMTGLFGIVPIAGPLVVAAIAFLVAVQQGLFVGLYTILLFAIAQNLEAYLFAPLVQKKATGLSPITIIFALLVGARVAGFWGIVIAIPLAAIVSEIWADIDERRKAKT